MDLRKLAKVLMFPHIAIMILLVPIAAVLLIGSMVFIGTKSVIAYISYVLAAYTLTVWCLKIPIIIVVLKNFKRENKYVRRWLGDARLRVKTSLYGALVWNTVYGIFQLWLGFYHSTFWFLSLGIYYVCLAFMRFGLVRHTRKYDSGEMLRTELIKQRTTGLIFLIMNMAISVIIFFMVYWNRTFEHHMITAIAFAAYTFTTMTVAIVNVIRYRKYNSPIYSTAKAISLAAACVSMLTLESTMLTTFGNETMKISTRRLFLALSGAAVSAFIISMAIYMIVQATKKIKTGVQNAKQ